MKKVRKQHFGSTIKGKITIYDKLYAKMNEAEKREFLSQLVDNVQIYEERKEKRHSCFMLLSQRFPDSSCS